MNTIWPTVLCLYGFDLIDEHLPSVKNMSMIHFPKNPVINAAAKSLQSCPTLWPQRRQPTRLPCPWDSPGKNTGVSCHFLLQCMKVKSGSEVAQSCPTLSDPMDCSPPGSSIHGIFQARVLEWGAIVFSASYQYKDKNEKGCKELICETPL